MADARDLAQLLEVAQVRVDVAALLRAHRRRHAGYALVEPFGVERDCGACLDCIDSLDSLGLLGGGLGVLDRPLLEALGDLADQRGGLGDVPHEDRLRPPEDEGQDAALQARPRHPGDPGLVHPGVVEAEGRPRPHLDHVEDDRTLREGRLAFEILLLLLLMDLCDARLEARLLLVQPAVLDRRREVRDGLALHHDLQAPVDADLDVPDVQGTHLHLARVR